MPEIARIMHRTGVRKRGSTGVEMGEGRYKIAQNTRQCLVTRPSYYIIYIIILYKYYIQNIMIVV